MSQMKVVMVACAFSLSMSLVPMANADLSYAIQSHAGDQNGHALSGMIVSTDTSINDGFLVAGEILSWQFSISGPNSTAVSSTDAGAALVLNGDVLISAQEITVDLPPIMSEMQFGLTILNGSGSQVVWARDELFGAYSEFYEARTPGGVAWSSNSPSMSGTDPWLVATRISSAPEPGTVGLFSFLAVAASMFRRRRTAV